MYTQERAEGTNQRGKIAAMREEVGLVSPIESNRDSLSLGHNQKGRYIVVGY